MTKPELAKRLAEAGDTTAAKAADRLDEIIFTILKKLRDGKRAALPGYGPIEQPRRATPTKSSPAKRKAQ